jgi:multimeric flavodoxin WrbA
MNIKILGVSGSPVNEGNTLGFLKASLQEASRIEGVSTELLTLGDKNIHDCIHCNWCLKKQSEGQFCQQKDDMDNVYPSVLAADCILFASPVYFGRLSGLSSIFFDRLRVFVHGNLYRNKLKHKVGGALAVGWLRNGGAEMTTMSINYGFWTLEMLVVKPGAVGISGIEGKNLISNDEYGLKSAQVLAKQCVEVTRLIKIGRASQTK